MDNPATTNTAMVTGIFLKRPCMSSMASLPIFSIMAAAARNTHKVIAASLTICSIAPDDSQAVAQPEPPDHVAHFRHDDVGQHAFEAPR